MYWTRQLPIQDNFDRQSEKEQHLGLLRQLDFFSAKGEDSEREDNIFL